MTKDKYSLEWLINSRPRAIEAKLNECDSSFAEIATKCGLKPPQVSVVVNHSKKVFDEILILLQEGKNSDS
jgi:hypothetical protein